MKLKTIADKPTHWVFSSSQNIKRQI